jgi:hypothetical protein
MNAIERTRMFSELVLIRSELKYRSCQLIREASLNVWQIKRTGEKLPAWLEFSQGSWSLKPLGSERKYPLIWHTILEGIADANK